MLIKRLANKKHIYILSNGGILSTILLMYINQQVNRRCFMF